MKKRTALSLGSAGERDEGRCRKESGDMNDVNSNGLEDIDMVAED